MGALEEALKYKDLALKTFEEDKKHIYMDRAFMNFRKALSEQKEKILEMIDNDYCKPCREYPQACAGCTIGSMIKKIEEIV